MNVMFIVCNIKAAQLNLLKIVVLNFINGSRSHSDHDLQRSNIFPAGRSILCRRSEGQNERCTLNLRSDETLTLNAGSWTRPFCQRYYWDHQQNRSPNANNRYGLF